MAPRARVYIETTTVSYLMARPSRDVRVAAHQQVTFEWWYGRRRDCDVFVSQLVLNEAAAGDPAAAADRLRALDGIPVLGLTEEAYLLSEQLLAQAAIPQAAAEDALHVAVATVNGMDYLVTWNCKHIANATMRVRIEDACADAGYGAPVICTPEELLEE